MMTKTRLGILFVIFAVLAGCSAPGATTVPEKKLDLTGHWAGTLTQELQSGPCRPMPAQTGDVLISQRYEGNFMMNLGEGFDCDPEEACYFNGHFEGNVYTALSSGIAGEEGMYVTRIEMIPDETGSTVNGAGSSTYTGPDYECEWQTSLKLVKK
jgi:hypothetical protein